MRGIMRDLTSQRELTIEELIEVAVGGTHPKQSPAFAPTLRQALADVAAGKIELVSRCIAGGAKLSTITRATACEWLRKMGGIMPAALAEPTSLGEAHAMIAELRHRLALLEAAGP
jgi:hypothetical protein